MLVDCSGGVKGTCNCEREMKFTKCSKDTTVVLVVPECIGREKYAQCG